MASRMSSPDISHVRMYVSGENAYIRTICSSIAERSGLFFPGAVPHSKRICSSFGSTPCLYTRSRWLFPSLDSRQHSATFWFRNINIISNIDISPAAAASISTYVSNSSLLLSSIFTLEYRRRAGLMMLRV